MDELDSLISQLGGAPAQPPSSQPLPPPSSSPLKHEEQGGKLSHSTLEGLDAVMNNFNRNLASPPSSLSEDLINLSSSDPSVRDAAIRRVVNKTVEEQGRQEIYRHNGVASILGMMKPPTPEDTLAFACQALVNFALDDDFRTKAHSLDCINLCISLLDCQNQELIERVLAVISNIVVKNERNRQAIANSPFFSKVKRHLSSSDKIKVRSLTAVANVCFNGKNHAQLVSSGILPLVKQTILAESDHVQKLATWLILVLSQCEGGACAHLASSGCLDALSQATLSPFAHVQDNALSAFVNLSGNPSVVSGLAKYMPQFEARLKRTGEPDSLCLTLQVLQNLAMDDNCMAAMNNTTIEHTISQVPINGANTKLQQFFCRALTNMAADDTMKNKLVANHLLGLVNGLKGSADTDVRRAAEQAHANLTR